MNEKRRTQGRKRQIKKKIRMREECVEKRRKEAKRNDEGIHIKRDEEET